MEIKIPPFILTTLKNLIQKKSTRLFPYEKRTPFPKSRGKLINNIESCIFCGACALKCPSKCIEVDKKQGLWKYKPYFCVFCGTCEEVCPTKSLSHLGDFLEPFAEKKEINLKGTPPKKKSLKPSDSK